MPANALFTVHGCCVLVSVNIICETCYYAPVTVCLKLARCPLLTWHICLFSGSAVYRNLAYKNCCNHQRFCFVEPAEPGVTPEKMDS